MLKSHTQQNALVRQKKIMFNIQKSCQKLCPKRFKKHVKGFKENLNKPIQTEFLPSNQKSFGRLDHSTDTAGAARLWGVVVWPFGWNQKTDRIDSIDGSKTQKHSQKRVFFRSFDSKKKVMNPLKYDYFCINGDDSSYYPIDPIVGI